VSVGGGISVGGAGVFVGGIGVSVGGMGVGVRTGVSVGTRVGVKVGRGVFVAVGTGVGGALAINDPNEHPNVVIISNAGNSNPAFLLMEAIFMTVLPFEQTCTTVKYNSPLKIGTYGETQFSQGIQV